MASTTTRWVKGCGCGCGLLTLALGLLGWAVVVYVKGIAGEAEEAEQIMAKLRERHGELSDFQPSPTGAIPPGRIEAFLQARELMADARRETEASLALLSSERVEGAEEVPGIVGRLLRWGLGAARIQGVTGLVPHAIGFVSARARALLETGVAPGEYLYLYSLAYYSWLGKSPADGPAFRLVGGGEGDHQERQGGQDEFDVREGRREEILRHLNQHLLPMLRRQLAAAEEDPAVSEEWRETLAAQVAAMEKDPFRIPWRDGLPEITAASLEPYRRPLESSYSALCNPLEAMAGE
jgi:hypothetical protein